ncbi:hypothetical protein [Niabella aurantiaca]|uniref:hypothetical protein n=1 Tax=Niabella aurantiaca TaxID=379900 RepID=UPI000381B624|nr:hypothetical protein [Niabella aurantiaca]
MLSYKPPFIETGPLTLFGDDVNPDVFYYVCMQPNVLRNEDHNPQMEAYAIIPESGVGERDGILESALMMDIGLAPEEADLKEAEKAIQKITGRKPKLLAPAPIHDAKVQLIVAAAGEEPDPKKWFVTKEINASVLGNNNAALVARATGNDAKLLIAALDADVVAASVHYSLTMLGIAPVFKATMKADWKKIYHHFEKFDKTNFIFYTDEISEAVDQLRETNAIEIEIQELDPDIKSEALKSLMNELKSEVFKKIFQPAASPLSAGSNWEDRIASGVSRVLGSLAIGAHHIRRNIDESQLFSTEINLSQKNVKTYPFYPQALLSSLLQRAGGIKERIRWIRLDEIPFIDQKVEVSLAADIFTNSNIKSVQVACRVRDGNSGQIKIQQSLVFDSDEKNKSTFNFTREKLVPYQYEYKATIFMQPAATSLPDKLETDWKTEASPYIYLNPASYFGTKELSINVDDTGIFDTAHLIEAVLKVVKKEVLGPVAQKTFLFSSADFQQKAFTLIADKSLDLQFNIELTYFLKQAAEHKAVYENVDTGLFFIPNPFENKWSVDLICHADWSQTQKVILETRIRDAEREDLLTNKFDFTKDSTETKLAASVSLRTPKETFEYRVTTVDGNGNIVQGPWKEQGGPVLVITDKIQSQRIIRATLTRCPDFEKNEIKQVTIEFVYDDKANQVHAESGRLAFAKPGDVAAFTHAMPDFNHKEFTYMVRVRGKGGQSYKSEWMKDTTDKINIEIPDKIW